MFDMDPPNLKSAHAQKNWKISKILRLSECLSSVGKRKAKL